MPEPFLGQSLADRREALETAAALSGRPVYLLEKDVWVVRALEILFASPFVGELAFKGGTSLSKAYGAIRRFSEDVDLTYDIRRLAPELRGEGALEALTVSQTNRWSKRIRKNLLPTWLRTELAPFIQSRIEVARLPASLRVEGADIYIDYKAVARAPGYVSPAVKLEFGARATGEPTEVKLVSCAAAPHRSMLAFPTVTPRVMRVERTFWEKATATRRGDVLRSSSARAIARERPSPTEHPCLDIVSPPDRFKGAPIPKALGVGAGWRPIRRAARATRNR
ncbi:MAG TPA: nucleotidyl transferase AbiEii/AbiGii toxin family protein [Caulobacteraceae bacterium]|jgi:hypothetical protein|nr:nucleotidyl transferase AbiEii/AbiGii toxin family protein [Caulobacteraceae bacterium]